MTKKIITMMLSLRLEFLKDKARNQVVDCYSFLTIKHNSTRLRFQNHSIFHDVTLINFVQMTVLNSFVLPDFVLWHMKNLTMLSYKDIFLNSVKKVSFLSN